MRITFTRTGGLVAAPGLLVRATAVFTATAGETTADRGYRRFFNEAESRHVTQAALAVCADLDSGPARRGVGRPDAFRFRFEIESGSDTVSLDDVDLPASAAMRVLSDWVAEKATRIVLREHSG
jgi:hypothetical protein